MKIGITHRLFMAILAAAALAVVCMLLIMQWSIGRGFLRYVNGIEQTRLTRLAERLEEHYAEKGSWIFVNGEPGQLHRLLADSPHGEEPGPPDRERREGPSGPRGARPPMPPHAERDFAQRVLLLDEAKRPIIAPPGIPANLDLKPLRNRDRVIGYLGLLPRRRLSDERQLRFLKEQKLALALVAGMVVLVAAGLSLPLANRLVRPIRALAKGTDRLAAGDFTIRVPVASSDELGQLARDFNDLALTLEKNEQARRQWVADISHELRTPLAVLRGEIEAMQDGIRQPTPEAIQSLHSEALRLGRLVDDLYQLSLSDLGALTYHKQELNLAAVLTEALAAFRGKLTAKNLELTVDIPTDRSIPLFGDPARLHQLLANLLDNCLKYTDSGGRIDVSLSCRHDGAILDIADSAPGVPDSDLERLFDRLYRVETSRNRSAGGAGLGLAICRNIVEAHSGSIAALKSPLGGVRIRVTLPLSEKC